MSKQKDINETVSEIKRLVKKFNGLISDSITTESSPQNNIDLLKRSLTVYLGLSGRMESDDTLNKLLKSSMHVVQAGGAGLTLYDELKERLVFRAAIGDGAEDILGYEVPLTGSQHGLAFATGEVQASAPIHSDVEKTTGASFRNVLVAPLLVDGEAIGTISAVNKQVEGNFTPSDMKAYLLFADVAALLVLQKSREQLLLSLIEGEGGQSPEELKGLGLGESELELLGLMRSLVKLGSNDQSMLAQCRELVDAACGLSANNSR